MNTTNEYRQHLAAARAGIPELSAAAVAVDAGSEKTLLRCEIEVGVKRVDHRLRG